MRLGLVALCLLCCLAACQSPSAMEEQGPSAVPSSQGFMMARSNCLPHDALIGLFKAYPQGRFFLNTSHGIVARDTKPPELKARTLEKLEQETAVPAGQTVWVTALLDQREVSVNVSHAHMTVKAGPYLWALRGKPRESAAASHKVHARKAAGALQVQPSPAPDPALPIRCDTALTAQIAWADQLSEEDHLMRRLVKAMGSP